MRISSTKEPIFLFFGDVLVFFVSLWLMLLVRYGQMPSELLFERHLIPFSILFLVWVLLFYIAGLYEKHTLLLKSKLPGIILRAQVINTIIAIIFFYLVPTFGVTPKSNLFIYLIVSFFLVLIWRRVALRVVGVRKKQKGLLIGSGREVDELFREVNGNTRYNLEFASAIDLKEINGIDFHKEIINRIYAENIQIVVIDINHERVEKILPHLYNLIFSHVHFVDMYKVYEEVFDRVPLSLVRYNWFLENLSLQPRFSYDVFKRLLDIILSLFVGTVSLLLYPFVILAIKLDDGGPVFYRQTRLGQNNQEIKVIKFRTMKNMDSSRESLNSKAIITRVGTFLRKTRIDELPQIWNVLKGDLSFIGPRPEIPTLAEVYEEEVAYYNVRHLVKPGLSGWAQLYQKEPPKFTPTAEQTRIKLSYDLYYIKNRSVVVDIKVALRTLQKIVSQSGS